MELHASEQLALLLYRANRHFQYLMTLHFKSYGITPEQWNVLKHLQEQDGMTPKELGYTADKDKTTITRMIDSLEQRNAIKRQIHSADRRSYRIYLTREGRELIQELQPIPNKVNKAASGGLTEGELLAFKKMLHTLQNQIIDETNRFRHSPLE